MFMDRRPLGRMSNVKLRPRPAALPVSDLTPQLVTFLREDG
jgi:hypothetical protein